MKAEFIYLDVLDKHLTLVITCKSTTDNDLANKWKSEYTNDDEQRAVKINFYSA